MEWLLGGHICKFQVRLYVMFDAPIVSKGLTHPTYTRSPSNATGWDYNDMGWNIVPDGLRRMLLWIDERYDSPLIYITENGSAEHEPDLQTSLSDEGRRTFFEDHLRACAEAIQAGVNLKGFFAWSLMDNFEWQFGYQRRFGICRVDYDTMERTPKSSALWYRDTIERGGANIIISNDDKRDLTVAGKDLRVGHRRLEGNVSRPLPDKLVIGYGSSISAVRKAVHEGLNVVIWSFLDVVTTIEPDADMAASTHRRRNQGTYRTGRIETSLNLLEVKALIQELDRDGYSHVVHLASVGGWNGRHLDPHLEAEEWYRVFRETVGDIFHGIDWDLEGNDRLDSSYNYFTLDCLTKMGEISRLVKEGTCGYLTNGDIREPRAWTYILISIVFNVARRVNHWNGSTPVVSRHRQLRFFSLPESDRTKSPMACRIFVSGCECVRIPSASVRNLD